MISIEALKRLGAIIDFNNRVCVFQAFSPEAFYFKEASSGHFMLDLTNDLLAGQEVSYEDQAGIRNLRAQIFRSEVLLSGEDLRSKSATGASGRPE